MASSLSRPPQGTDVDVIIVGAGPAGLEAAIVLGRCRRFVAVFDSGEYRNTRAQGVHCYLGHEGIRPEELRRLGREALQRYEHVTLREARVVDARALQPGFSVALHDGTQVTCRKLLLATGVVDEIPQIPGLDALYGSSVFHCPYCDGWEHRDQALVVYGKGSNAPNAAGLALELLQWSRDLLFCTDGPSGLDERTRLRLARHRIVLREEPIAELVGNTGKLESIRFKGGEQVPRDAVFFCTPQHQRSELPAKLGCAFTEDGAVNTDMHEATNVPGLYVAGDASRRAQFAIVSAGEGAMAAEAINNRLTEEDLSAELGA
jgi:thioredoxin reductase